MNAEASSVFTPGTRVKTLRAVGSWPAGTTGVVEEISAVLLADYDCYVHRTESQSGMCFMFTELELAS